MTEGAGPHLAETFGMTTYEQDKRHEDRAQKAHAQKALKKLMAEHDPTGRDAHAPGTKLDAGKPRAGLVLGDFSRALMAVAQVGTFGAEKYSPSGWLAVPDAIERYTDAMYRHLLYEAQGEADDPDSGLAHAAHAAWNALARLELALRKAERE